MINQVKSFFNKYAALSDVAKATFWFFLCNILLKSISLITTPIFTRLLSTEQYGIYNTYVSWVQIVTIIVTFRLDYGIFNKGMSQYPDQKDDYNATMQSITSILTFIFFLIYLILHSAINRLTGLSTLITIALFAEVFFTNAISFWMVRQRYDFKYKSVVAISISMTLANALLGILAVLLTNHCAVGRILSTVLVQVCFGLCIYMYNLKKAKHIFVKDFAKFAISFNIPLLPHYFASYILDQFDRIMIMKLVSYSAVGIYSIAYSSGFVIKIISSSLNNTLIPWQYRRLQEKDFSSIAECVKSIAKCVLLCFMGYMAFAPEIIRIFATREYYEAIYVLPPVVASVFLIFLYELYANIEFYYNENKFTMYIALGAALLNIVLNYLLIPRWGYVMAAYTTVISYSVLAIAHFLYMQHIVKKKESTYIFSAKDFWIYLIIILLYSTAVPLLFRYPVVRYGWITLLLLYAVIARKRLFKFIHILK